MVQMCNVARNAGKEGALKSQDFFHLSQNAKFGAQLIALPRAERGVWHIEMSNNATYYILPDQLEVDIHLLTSCLNQTLNEKRSRQEKLPARNFMRQELRLLCDNWSVVL